MSTEKKIAVGYRFNLVDEEKISTRFRHIFGELVGWECNDCIEVVAVVEDSAGNTKYVCLNKQPDVLTTCNLPIEFFDELDSIKQVAMRARVENLVDAIQQCENIGLRVFYDTDMIIGATLVKHNSEVVVTLCKG